MLQSFIFSQIEKKKKFFNLKKMPTWVIYTLQIQVMKLHIYWSTTSVEYHGIMQLFNTTDPPKDQGLTETTK